MNKPSEVPGIPIPVWIAALNAVGAEVVGSEDHSRIVAVAEAILSERERCARIADDAAGLIRLGGPHAWHGASYIASAIRNPA